MSAQNEIQEQVLGGRVSHFEPSNNRKCSNVSGQTL